MPALNEDETDLVDEDEDGNIIPSDRLAAQSSAQLEDELARFRNEWKMELLKDQKPSKTTETNKPSRTESQQQRKSNRMEHHELPRRPKTTTSDNESKVTPSFSDLDYEQPRTNEDKAKYLFDKAVQLEQQGRHYDAIKFYRMAMQLDADIEFKIASVKRPTVKKPLDVEEELEVESVDDENTDSNEQQVDELKTLYDKFSTMSVEESRICEKNFPQKVT